MSNSSKTGHQDKQGEKIMAKLSKLNKVSESITINRYDNGWMIEVSGRDKKEDWKTAKLMCNTEDEVVAVVREWNNMDLDN
jgi:hypothetical protein